MGEGGAGRETPGVPLPLLAALVLLLVLSGCRDLGPSGPGTPPPVLRSISPAAASPARAPLIAVLEGENLEGVELQLPGPFVGVVTEREEGRVRFRMSFRSAPGGEYWIRVEGPGGRDSIPFTVRPLEPGERIPEARGLWVSRFEFGGPGDIRRYLERAAAAGFTLVYLQVRGRADAFYRSSYEPWSARLTGTLGRDPGWDPLGLAVETAHALGLELHAWINAFTGWAGPEPPPTSEPLHAFLEHPEWVMVDSSGSPMPYGAGSRWMTPGHPGVRARLAAVAADIARRYDVDGIHLDFIRYPSTGYSLDAASLAAFDSVRAVEPSLDFAEMRRRFVTWSMEEVRDSLRAVGRPVVLSAAVWGVYRNEQGWIGVTTGYDDVLQDAREWDRLGLVDALVPMVYWRVRADYGDRLDFAYLADEHAAALEGPAFIGVYVPGMDADALALHVERARLAGAEGVALFSASALDESGLWGALRSGPFLWPAAFAGGGRSSSPPPREGR